MRYKQCRLTGDVKDDKSSEEKKVRKTGANVPNKAEQLFKSATRKERKNKRVTKPKGSVSGSFSAY